MATLLLELFSEEIPARMQHHVPRAFRDSLLEKCVAAGLAPNEEALKAELYVTPRRIAVLLHDLPEKQPDMTIEKKGPKTSAPEKAIEGFLRSCGQQLDDLEIRTLGKDEVYFSVVQQQGKPTADILITMIEESLQALTWPKSMRWGDTDIRWVRPLHSICCLLDHAIVPVTFGPITASNTTHGHRFMAPASITIDHPDDYLPAMQKAYVMLSQQERSANIAKQMNALAQQHNLTIRADQKLLDEVTGLVEWPVALLGSIEQRFMTLPHELLQMTMSIHQKYFTLEMTTDGERGQQVIAETNNAIAPHFIFVANRETDDGGEQIIKGNERVLRARLSDAEFFFAQDQKKRLSEWAKGLSNVTFHAKLGTVADKTLRVEQLARKIYEIGYHHEAADDTLLDDVIDAARLSKADLVTGMVGEFPELQGIIGSYYGHAEGLNNNICEALYHLYDHPQQLQNLGPVAQIICLADRLDTLISLFSIDEKPTGSKDPFALRRAALGVIAIIRNHGLRVSMRDLLQGNQELITFFNDRLEADLQQQDIDRNTLRAIGGLMQDDDIIRVHARAAALQSFLASEDSSAMLAAYKRAANILSAEQKKDGQTYNADGLDAALLVEHAEKELIHTLASVTQAINPLLVEENYSQIMQEFSKLKQPLDQFFADIMVNADNADLRRNRLCLLASIIGTMHHIANFSHIAS